MSYGDAAVDDILATAEVYAGYQIDTLLTRQLDALMALPDSPARAAGRVRLEALLAGAPSSHTPEPPAPYNQEPPPRTGAPPTTHAVVHVGEYRRASCTVKQLLGCSADEVRAVLGPADSEHEGEVSATDDALGPKPNIEPGRPYVVWAYGRMLDPAEPVPPESPWPPMEHGSTWWLYFLASGERGAMKPTVVVEASAIPAGTMF